MSVAAQSAANGKFIPIRGPGGARPRLLLAEDSKAARILTAALLRRMGCEVDAVEHGQDAVNLAQDRKYDLILLDIEMPILDGVGAARQIRALGGEVSRTPLMALSAFLADSAKSDSWRSFFDHAIPKPAGRDELRAVIQAILDSHPEILPQIEPASPGETEGAALVDWSVAGEIQAHLPLPQWLEVVLTAEAEIIACIAEMRTGSGEPQKLAHKVKGIAASFGLTRLAAEARRLESMAGAGGPEAARLMQLAVRSMDSLRSERRSDEGSQHGRA
jgi:CheY-like chemotaxis protein